MFVFVCIYVFVFARVNFEGLVGGMFGLVVVVVFLLFVILFCVYFYTYIHAHTHVYGLAIHGKIVSVSILSLFARFLNHTLR